MLTKTFKITGDSGLHSQPTALLVNTASLYQSSVVLNFHNKSVDLKSILGVLSLGVPKGSDITITVEGLDADEAMNAVEELLKQECLID